MAEKSAAELTEIADALFMAAPCVGCSVDEEQMSSIIGNLSSEDWKRLYAVYLLRYCPQETASILAG